MWYYSSVNDLHRVKIYRAHIVDNGIAEQQMPNSRTHLTQNLEQTKLTTFVILILHKNHERDAVYMMAEISNLLTLHHIHCALWK